MGSQTLKLENSTTLLKIKNSNRSQHSLHQSKNYTQIRMKYLAALALTAGSAMANTASFQPQSQTMTSQQYQDQYAAARQANFGANAQVGFGDQLGGSAGFQAGPIGANISAGVNNNLLMTVIVGLGLLSFLNIVATVATPFLSSFTSAKSLSGDDEVDEAEDATTARRYQRNLRFITDNVLNAIESFSDKHQ